MEMVEVSLGKLQDVSNLQSQTRDLTGWIKHWFPEFEFTWLGEEMRENLPKEMNFVHEASNAERTVRDFQDVRTSLYIRRLEDPFTAIIETDQFP